MQSGVFGQLARFMETIDVMLSDLGLEDLSANERAVLLAMSACASRDHDGQPVSHTEQARAHRLARQISQPTFHRNLRRLADRGIVRKADGLGAGEYVIVTPQTVSTEMAPSLDRPSPEPVPAETGCAP
jgi:DNA-binding MarR family transcriptional regulator